MIVYCKPGSIARTDTVDEEEEVTLTPGTRYYGPRGTLGKIYVTEYGWENTNMQSEHG